MFFFSFSFFSFRRVAGTGSDSQLNPDPDPQENSTRIHNNNEKLLNENVKIFEILLLLPIYTEKSSMATDSIMILNQDPNV